jgi:hypothetical protein
MMATVAFSGFDVLSGDQTDLRSVATNAHFKAFVTTTQG